MGYTKLFSDLIMSTVWREEDPTRILWITMLALRDRWHIVNASLPGLADAARIPLDKCIKALEILSRPDPYSRTTEYEGRRIEACEGGWVILNGEKYRNKMSIDDRREYLRIKKREQRARDKEKANVNSCQQSSIQSTQTEAETEKETYKDQKNIDFSPSEKPPDDPPPENQQSKPKNNFVPYTQIVNLYHEILSALPRVAKLTTKRKTQIRQRWNEDMPKLENWRNYFIHVSNSDFLMGRKDPTPGHPKFRADIEWLTNQTNFTKIAEDKYHV